MQDEMVGGILSDGVPATTIRVISRRTPALAEETFNSVLPAVSFQLGNSSDLSFGAPRDSPRDDIYPPE